MKGFVIDATYRIRDDKPYVFLFGRLENGESFAVVNSYKPYFFIKEKDLERAKKIEKFDCEKTDLKNFYGKKVVKIITDIPSNVKELRETFEDAEIITYEADIMFAKRFLMDHGIKGGIDVEGDYEYQNGLKVFKEASIKPVVYKPKLQVLSIDIETNSDATEIYSVSLATDKIKKVLIRKKVKGAIYCKTESELLEKFISEVNEIDPDVITGWHVIDFDLKVIQERCKLKKIPFAIGRDGSQCRLRIVSDFFKTSRASVAGRIVLDALQLLKNSFIKVRDYKLETAARTFLGKGKLIKFKKKQGEIEELFRKNPKKLADYNLVDAELVLGIIKKTGVLDLAIQKSLLTGMALDRVSASIASFDSLYLAEARKRKLVCPTGTYKTKKRSIKGGFVMEPEPGVYDYILVLDFKSLYPSIIRTFNIDPASFVSSCKGKDLVKAPNGACFRNEEGILPLIIQHLWEARDKARKQKDELTRQAIKTLMASFFGVLATPNCRFFNMKVANAITHFGQHLIKLTAKKIKESGYQVIYEDTDSCFVKSNAKNLKQAEKIGNELQDSINNYYDKHIKRKYKRKSYLEMEYEKCFVKFLMPKLRRAGAGAKKRYAGLLPNEKIDITGLEFVRGDWTDLAREFQYNLLDLLFHGKELDNYIRNLVKKLRDGKLDKLLTYRKSIRKPLDEYIATTPPHVKAARQLERLESTKIEYVITEEGPEPIQKIRHKVDYEHYIKKQLKPIADSILCFFERSFEDVLEGNTQANLGSFS